MRIIKRKLVGYILGAVAITVCLVDFMTSVLLHNLDQLERPLNRAERRRLVSSRAHSFAKTVTATNGEISLLNGSNRTQENTLKKSFLDSLRSFFVWFNQTRQLAHPHSHQRIRTHSLFPTVGDQDDRILAQMSHVPRAYKPSTPLRVIVVMAGTLEGSRAGQSKFLEDRCPVNRCYLTTEQSYARKAHALLWHHSLGEPSFPKPNHQIWVYYALESPHHTPQPVEFADKINWTCTYRSDSTIVTPYEKFVPYNNHTNTTGLPSIIGNPRNFASGKTRKVAWFVSNCNPANNRNGYVEELEKHIKVDVYGKCGPLKCSVLNQVECFQMVSRTYKFYLSFENSNCKDYITEKFFVNGLQNDVIPIVMGARKEQYELVAPPKSFIHVDDFESPKELADYLNRLDADDSLYNEYFRWKGSGHFINTKFWCRLCAMLHEAPSAGKHWYKDIWRWWRHDTCVAPTDKNPWASWRSL